MRPQDFERAIKKARRAHITRPPRSWTPNQIIAYNLKRVREGNAMSQKTAAKHCAEYLGREWSVASWSAAEVSANPDKRPRKFTADDIVGFSQAFDVPVSYFFALPRLEDGDVIVTADTPTAKVVPAASYAAKQVAEHESIQELQSMPGELYDIAEKLETLRDTIDGLIQPPPGEPEVPGPRLFEERSDG